MVAGLALCGVARVVTALTLQTMVMVTASRPGAALGLLLVSSGGNWRGGQLVRAKLGYEVARQ